MVELRPFPGLRFNPQRIGDFADVICPPYDVISPAEQERLYDRSPFNLVRLELGREYRDDTEQENRYTRAAATLSAWRQERALVQDRLPCLYLHEARFSLGARSHARRDLLAAVTLTPWDAGIVLPHERTMARPKEDRLRLLRATRVQLSPVWLLYRQASAPLAAAWEAALARSPQQQLVDQDGVEHRLWVVSDPHLLDPLVSDFLPRTLYMADGHHRYETALAFQSERRAAATQLVGPAASDAVFAVLTDHDDSGLAILPIHRLIAGLAPDLDARVRALLDPVATIEPLDVPEGSAGEAFVTEFAAELPGRPSLSFGLVLPGGRRLWRVALRDPASVWGAQAADRSAAYRALDVSLLHALLIDPLVRESRAEPEDALRFSYASDDALREVRAARADVAVLVAPTRVEQVLAVAEAHDRMPQKSTFFVPKTPTGLVLYPLE